MKIICMAGDVARKRRRKQRSVFVSNCGLASKRERKRLSEYVSDRVSASYREGRAAVVGGSGGSPPGQIPRANGEGQSPEH